LVDDDGKAKLPKL